MRKIYFLQKWYDQREKNEEGQSLVIIAFMLIGILAFVGIAVDVGFIFARGSQLQAAVDAAALAGVTELVLNKEAADTKAGQFLNANRVPITGTQRTATFLSTDDLTPLGANEYTVTVTWPVELFFLRLLRFDDVNLTRSATAASFSLTDIYASRRVEEGSVGTSTQGIFGPDICTAYGDPFSPSRNNPMYRIPTYKYRILIPSDYSEDFLRIELFDPDSINDANNNVVVKHTDAAQGAPGNLLPTANKTCGVNGGRSEQKHPCILRTDELTLTTTLPYSETYQLDNVNPFWFVRVDENRQGDGSGGCVQDGPPNYDPALNTQTLFDLYYYRSSDDGNPVRVGLATYTGQASDDVHDTDLRWVSPGGALSFDQTVPVPKDIGSDKDFELDLNNDVPGILVEPGTGNRYLYLDVTSLSGASENNFEIWAGPNTYVGTVPSDVNERNLHVRNEPHSHSSKGVTVFGLGNLPMNGVYGNCDTDQNPDPCDDEPDRPVDIPLIYVGPEYAGSTIHVSLFDSDSGARPPVTFYFDSIAKEDWSMTFGVAGQIDPDGVPADPTAGPGARTCLPGSCNNQWVDPPYQILVPGILDNCDWQNTDPTYIRDNCTPFYGGRLIARYIGGQYDSYGWEIRLTGLPYLVR